VDLDQRFILFQQSKTKRYASKSAVQIPIHPELEDYFVTQAKMSDKPDVPVFPELHDKSGSGKSGMSMAFKRIMAKADIADGSRKSERGGKGRATSLLSFHSLRHSFNSALANAGVSQELRQKATGHASADMNTIYTDHELQNDSDCNRDNRTIASEGRVNPAKSLRPFQSGDVSLERNWSTSLGERVALVWSLDSGKPTESY